MILTFSVLLRAGVKGESRSRMKPRPFPALTETFANANLNVLNGNKHARYCTHHKAVKTFLNVL